jgi:pSer/pThr/pTyr-binding forkhead associated (FHA) protein
MGKVPDEERMPDAASSLTRRGEGFSRRSRKQRLPYNRRVAPLVLEVLEGKNVGLQVPVSEPVEAGREAGCGLCLDDSAVSEHHARFTSSGAEATVEDLGSATGTYVNELQVIGQSVVRPGDRVRVGMTVLELVTEQQAIADRTRPKRPPVPELSAQVLEHVPLHELPSGYDTRPASLRVEETDAAFITDDAPAARGEEERFGALAAWTDSRVKHQTELTAFGLLAVAALAVILVFFH